MTNSVGLSTTVDGLEVIVNQRIPENVRVVNDDATGANNGTSWDDAYRYSHPH